MNTRMISSLMLAAALWALTGANCIPDFGAFDDDIDAGPVTDDDRPHPDGIKVANCSDGNILVEVDSSNRAFDVTKGRAVSIRVSGPDDSVYYYSRDCAADPSPENCNTYSAWISVESLGESNPGFRVVGSGYGNYEICDGTCSCSSDSPITGGTVIDVDTTDRIMNGDFEDGYTGFMTDLPYGGLDYGKRAIVTSDPSNDHWAACSYGDHTSGYGNMLAVNVDPPDPNAAVWAQTVDVSSQQTYVFSFWVSSWHVPNGDKLRVRINGAPAGAAFEVPKTCGVWEQLQVTWSSGPNTTASIKIVDESAGGSDFAIDDISMYLSNGFTDQCPDDPDKIEPGICGCGVSDSDSDSDGTADCLESAVFECPSTGYDDGYATGHETACGHEDAMNHYWQGAPYDADTWTLSPSCLQYQADFERGISDGAQRWLDCQISGRNDCCSGFNSTDECPDDPNKTNPGICGCGVPEGWCGNSETLIANGDFEQGYAAFTTDLPYGGLDYGMRAIVTSDPSNNHWAACSYGDHTSGYGNMLAVNVDPPDPNAAVWAQTVDVSSYQTYVFSFWVSSWHVPNGDQLRVIINGIPAGSQLPVPSACGVWEMRQVTWYSGSSTTAAIKIVDEVAGGSDFALDDITLQIQ